MNTGGRNRLDESGKSCTRGAQLWKARIVTCHLYSLGAIASDLTTRLHRTVPPGSLIDNTIPQILFSPYYNGLPSPIAAIFPARRAATWANRRVSKASGRVPAIDPGRARIGQRAC